MPSASASSVHEPGLAVESIVRSKRIALGLSQRELGKRAHMSAAYVSALEKGNLAPSLVTFSRLAVELRLTPMEIFLVIVNEAKRDPSLTVTPQP